VGPPVFNTGGAALGVARWVRLPCAPAIRRGIDQSPMIEPQTPDDQQVGPDWPAYYRATIGREPRPLFARGMRLVAEAGLAPGNAVEVGFGDGTETLALLADGWRVLAIDPTPAAAEVLRPRVPPSAASRLEILTARVDAIGLPPFDLLYAGYAFPFIRPETFPRVWADVVARVRPGGFLVVNLFGVHDTWASDPDMTFVDAERVHGLVAGLEVAVLDEVENDGDSFDGPKHWHVFDVVARRPVDEPR
jgi:SAM-dependent methyltransferase